MATHHSSRPSNQSKRPLPALARPSKPAPLSAKRSSSHGASKKVAHHKQEEVEDEDLMAVSFLQFCTTCEKQIVTPSNFVLYCSESCRKKDNEKQLHYSHDQSPPLTPFTNFSFEDLHFRDIVPPRSPTIPSRSQRSSCAFSEPSSDDNTSSDNEKQQSRKDSDASRYLRQFHAATAASETTPRQTRPKINRASTSNSTFTYGNTYSAAPSLSNTPASSVGYSLPYTPSTRPLPPRNPTHSSSYGARSIDLVTPFHYSTVPSSPPQYSLKSAPVSTTSKGNAEGEILYAKSPIPSASPVNGSLKQLFATSSRWTS